ncbi:MAG: hypothetical protein RIC15_11780 [Vicingaceae bacterium]
MNYFSIRNLLLMLFLFSSLLPLMGQAGGLAAYTDYLRRFYIFDKGEIKLIEEQAPKSFKVGGSCVAYVDYADNFKIYQNGEVKTLEIGSVRNYEVTEYLVAYSMTDMLKVYDDGKVKTLSPNTKEFYIGDSLVVFYDYYFNSINAYYKGKIFSQRLRWVGNTIQKIAAGPNITALITAEDRNFWIFYQGERHLINQLVEDVDFKVGQDIVAYMDQPTRTFKAFYKGEIYDIEDFQPTSYWMGRGRIVYIDQVGNFKTFYDGKIATIASYEPVFYKVRDSLIVYQELDRFKCYYGDNIYEIAPYLPDHYEFSRNVVAYMDRNRVVQIFREGKTEKVDYGGDAMINDFKLMRDVILVNVGVNKNVIYYKGKIYQ